MTWCRTLLLLQGDLVLRAGSYVNSRDTQFQLRGVYVVDSGRLHAVARPTAAVEAPVHGGEAAQHTADYRRIIFHAPMKIAGPRAWA